MKITLMNRLLKPIIGSEGCDTVEMKYDNPYCNEDILLFELNQEELERCKGHVRISIDSNLKDALIYMPKGSLMYQIPMGWKLRAYHPSAFSDKSIQVTMSMVSKDQLTIRRNLAMNKTSEGQSFTFEAKKVE